MMNSIRCYLILFLVPFLLEAQRKAGSNVPGPVTTFPLPRFVEEVTRKGNEVVIPYKRYVLDNGLQVIIHEDHSDPLVYVDVTYHVGSAREQQGRSGFAHFFEHMMFQGSKHVGDDQHFKIVSEAGGHMNGTTNTDRTNYFQVVPSNYLEKMLWLESDRMGFLLDSVTQKKFEVQRATVKNERGQRYDNMPYGLEREKIGEALYPIGHPYSWLTIGYIEDLNRVDVNDLKRFYMRWYGPNNAVLTIAGDVETDKVLLLVQKYFGSIAPCPAVRSMSVAPVKLTANRYISYEDNVKFPMLTLAWPSPKDGDKDDVAMTVLGRILSGSEGSPLYKTFTESKKATSAMAFQISRELAGQFQLSIRANPGTSLTVTEKEVRQMLTEWEKKGGASESDILKYKAQFQSHLYDRLQTVQGKGATLASNYTLMRDANYLKKHIAMNLSVTKEDVMRVYNKYIKNRPAVICSTVPKGKGELKAAPDSWKMYTRKIETESKEYKNLSYKMPAEDWDRSQQPKAGPATPLHLPPFFTATVAGGIPMIGISEDEIPKVDILLSFRAGHLYESKEKSGLAHLTSAMMNKSTLRTSSEELENRMDMLGASIHFFADNEEMHMNVEAPKDKMHEALKLAEEILFEPKFDAAEFELVKKRQIDGITQAQSNASQIADEAFMKLLYGKEHVMGYPAHGTRETIQGITIEEIRKYYEGLNASMLTVAVSGDITKEEAVKDLEFLSKMKKGVPLKESAGEIPVVDKTRIYFIDKKNAPQSEIRLGYVAMPYDCCGDHFKSNAMNFSLSGAFNSRISYLLREVKGWTYGCRGGFSAGKYRGPYAIHGGFRASATDSAITEMFRELKNFADHGITENELEFTKHAIAQSDGLQFESPGQKLMFVKRILDYGLSEKYVFEKEKVLEELKVSDVNALAKKYLPYNNMVMLVVGDKESNLEKIRKLGFEVVELEQNAK